MIIIINCIYVFLLIVVVVVVVGNIDFSLYESILVEYKKKKLADTQSNQGNPCYTHITTLLLSIEPRRPSSNVSKLFSQQGSCAICPPIIILLLPQSSGASVWPPGRGFYVRRISERKEWPSASASAQHNAYQTEEQGILYSDTFKAITVMYMRPIDRNVTQGNNLCTCFSLKINLLLLWHCQRLASLFSPKLLNLDSRSVFIRCYRTAANKHFDPWGKVERKDSAEEKKRKYRGKNGWRMRGGSWSYKKQHKLTQLSPAPLISDIFSWNIKTSQ